MTLYHDRFNNFNIKDTTFDNRHPGSGVLQTEATPAQKILLDS